MLRYPTRTLTRSTTNPALLTSSRHFTDKLLIGSCSAFLTCSTTIGLFHLLVTPISGTVAAATLATATASGGMSVIEGSSSGGTSFGAVCGVFVGAMGCAYAKSQKEPWRK